MNTPIERLQTALETLGLKAVEARLENLLEQASKKEPSYADFLDELLSCEVEARRTRYLRARLQFAHFPFVKTFEQFDFGFQPSLDDRQIRVLRSRRFDHRHSDSGPAAASLDDHQHSRRELPAEGSPQGRPGATSRTGRGGGRGSFLGLGLRSAQSAPKDGAGLHSVRGQGGPFMRFRGGEFSTGTMRNFQPELTLLQRMGCWTVGVRVPPSSGGRCTGGGRNFASLFLGEFCCYR